MMILIPRGGREYRCIGLVETIWKVYGTIVNCRLQSSIVLHDLLHGFRQRRGAGTAIIESKLEQQLAGIVHEPLFQVFIDVSKTYNSLDWVRCMVILRGCGLGPKLQRILQRYWDGKMLVPKSGNYYGCPFSTGRELTQWYPVSPTPFNIVVDAVIGVAL